MYTRIDLLRDIYEYEKEMRQYEEDNRKFTQSRQEAIYDPEQKSRRNREIHPEHIRKPVDMGSE